MVKVCTELYYKDNAERNDDTVPLRQSDHRKLTDFLNTMQKSTFEISQVDKILLPFVDLEGEGQNRWAWFTDDSYFLIKIFSLWQQF